MLPQDIEADENGWYNVGESGRFANDTIVVTGKWTKKQYRVTYQYDGTIPSGVADVPAEKGYKWGEKVSLAAAPADTETHTFGRWTGVSSDAAGQFEMPMADITITGRWVEKSIKVNPNGGLWNGNGDETVYSYQSYLQDKGSDNFPDANRENYVFEGWEESEDSEGSFVKVLTAKWTAKNYTVTLSSGEGYTIEAVDDSASPVNYGGSYTFRVKVASGYNASGMKVMVNGSEVPLNDANEYTIKNIAENTEVTVTGVADTEAPGITITMAGKTWISLLDSLLFNLFYKENQTVTITADDQGSGVKKIWYYLADGGMTADNVKQITEWQEYNASFSISEEKNYVIYVKAEDEAGNISYANSDGFVLDKTVPKIEIAGITSEGVCCEGAKVTVTEKNLEEITVNGFSVTLDADNSITLTEKGEQTIIVTDKAGNVSSRKVTLSAHDWSGNWVVKNEPTATEDGVEETACTRGCGEKMLKTIPAAGDGEVWSGVITSDGVKIVDCSGSDTAVEVPSEIDGRSVTAISKDAFDGHTEITSVTVPVSVTAVGEGAFADCTGLATIMIPEGLDTTKAGITDTAAKIIYRVDENGKIIITSVTPGTDRDGGKKPVTIPDTIGGKKPEISDAVKEAMKNIPHEHRGGTATCTQKAVCEICGGEYGDFAGHTLAKTEGEKPTCTADGRRDCWTCSECGKIFSDENGSKEITAEEVKLAALGHDWSGSWVVKNEPTATEDGVEETACTRGCGEKMLKTIPAAGDGEVWSGVITSDGVEIVDCFGSDTAVEVPSEIDGRPVTAISKDAFDGHTEIASVTVPVSVTAVGEDAFDDCTGLATIMIPEGLDTTKAGITDTAAKIIYRVDENGKIIITSVTPGTDRDGGKKPVTIPDTIGGKKPEISDAVKEAMKNIPHEHRGGTATCTQKAVCEICGEGYGDFAGHTLAKTEGEKPTCTADGNKTYWICAGCKKMFSDRDCTKEVTAEEVKLAALGHDWSGNWVVAQEPTVTEDGVEETACTHGCGEKKQRTIQITGDGFWSVITSDGVKIVGYSGSDTAVEVPSVIGGKSVTAIGENAFDGKTEITSVTIPVSVTVIGDGAFADCTGLTTIMIPEGLDTTKAGIIDTAAKITYRVDGDGKIIITSVTPGTDRDGGKKPVTIPDTIEGKKPEIPDAVKETMKNIPHEHRGGAATCIQKAACEICGEEYGDSAGHTFPEQWMVEKEATESESGRQYKICETCGTKIYRTIDPLGTPADPYAGKIEKEVEVLPGAPDTVLNNSKEELAQSVLEKEELAEVENGTDAKIWLEIAPDVKIDKEDKAQIQKAAEESVGAGAEVTCLDVSLFKQVGNGEKMPIHELGRAISVTIVIPEKLQNKDVRMVRNYQIIRLHEGKTDIIEGTYNEESAEFTFETDKFSTYAICYKDSPKQGELETPTPTPGGTTEPGTPKPTPEMSSKEEQTENELTLNAKIKVSQSGRKIKVSWGRISSAEGYDVYVQYCGKKFTKKSITAIKSGKTTKVTVKKINGKPLNRKENYKIYVLAYKLADGKKITLGKSMIAHIVGRMNTKYTNVKAVKVKKSSYRLKKGKTVQIKARTVLVSPGKKQLTNAHAKQFRYATTNKKVVTVSKKGKIKAVGKGNCTIYVYARNGYAKKIKVIVK